MPNISFIKLLTGNIAKSLELVPITWNKTGLTRNNGVDSAAYTQRKQQLYFFNGICLPARLDIIKLKTKIVF